MIVGMATVQNLGGFLVFRFLGGLFSAVTIGLLLFSTCWEL
jgi:hypothetical protein